MIPAESRAAPDAKAAAAGGGAARTLERQVLTSRKPRRPLTPRPRLQAEMRPRTLKSAGACWAGEWFMAERAG